MGREVAPSSTCHTSLSLRSCVFVASMVSFEILDFSCFFFLSGGVPAPLSFSDISFQFKLAAHCERGKAEAQLSTVYSGPFSGDVNALAQDPVVLHEVQNS